MVSRTEEGEWCDDIVLLYPLVSLHPISIVSRLVNVTDGFCDGRRGMV